MDGSERCKVEIMRVYKYNKELAVDFVGIPLALIRRLVVDSRMVAHGGAFEVEGVDVGIRSLR